MGFKAGPADLLPINPPAEDLAELREKLLEQRAAARAAKKDKKKEKATAAAAKRPAEAAEAANGDGSGSAGANGNGLYAGEAARSNGGAAVVNGSGAAAKKFKATELMPSHADKKVWESLFTSSRAGEEKESYLCRSTAARGMHLT